MASCQQHMGAHFYSILYVNVVGLFFKIGKHQSIVNTVNTAVVHIGLIFSTACKSFIVNVAWEKVIYPTEATELTVF